DPAPALDPERRRRRRRPRPSTAPLVTRDDVVPAALRRYATDQRAWRPGNEVILLRAGAEAFPAMLDAIASARRSIAFEVYIYQSDATGVRFAEALIERARAGVTVRLLFDAIGSFGVSGALLDRMRAAGVRICEYHPVVPWRHRWNVFRR